MLFYPQHPYSLVCPGNSYSFFKTQPHRHLFFEAPTETFSPKSDDSEFYYF